MPELPEVETIRRGLALRIERPADRPRRTAPPDLRRPFPPDLADRLEGARIGALARRGKYILIDLDDGGVLAAASRHVRPDHRRRRGERRPRSTTTSC